MANTVLENSTLSQKYHTQVAQSLRLVVVFNFKITMKDHICSKNVRIFEKVCNVCFAGKGIIYSPVTGIIKPVTIF